MATVEPNQQSEILSFVTKFLELTSHGYDVELRMVQKNGEISVNMCTNLKNLLTQLQIRTPDMEKVVRLPRPRNIDLKISAIVRDSRVLQQTQQRILFK